VRPPPPAERQGHEACPSLGAALGLWFLCSCLLADDEAVRCGRAGGLSVGILGRETETNPTHCHLHVGPVPHVSESSPSAVLQRRLIRRRVLKRRFGRDERKDGPGKII
jgi:hypothetical protein